MPATLPDVNTAYQNVFDGLHNRIFFGRLASRGHTCHNDKQAAVLLELAGKLEGAELEAQQKVGADSSDPYVAANAALDNVLAASGFTSGTKQAAAEAENSLEAAAAELAQDPTIYDSVLALKAAEAQDISAWLDAQAKNNA